MALVTTIRQSLLSTRWVPWWLTGPNRGRILYSIGLALDAGAEWAVQGIQQRLPLWCDEGALSWLGRDRGIIRGLNESTASYRQRLVRWRDTWRRAGTAFSILENVQAYFLPEVPVVRLVCHHVSTNTADWYTRGTDGVEAFHRESPSNFDYDSLDAGRPVSLGTRDTRFYIIVEQSGAPGDFFAPRSSAQAVARDAASKNGVVSPAGAGVPATMFADFVNIARTWKMAGSYVSAILVHFGPVDPAGTGADYPDGQWFNPLNDTLDGNRIPQTWRVLYVDRYPGDHLPASPEPYPV